MHANTGLACQKTIRVKQQYYIEPKLCATAGGFRRSNYIFYSVCVGHACLSSSSPSSSACVFCRCDGCTCHQCKCIPRHVNVAVRPISGTTGPVPVWNCDIAMALVRLQVKSVICVRVWCDIASMDAHQHDILSRVVRIENTLNTLSFALNVQISAIGNLQTTIEQQFVQLNRDRVVPPASPSAPLQSVGPNVGPVADVESSTEAQKICPYPSCTLSVKGCSAAKSLRHMQICSCCPDAQARYLDIALHMNRFQKHPRVTDDKLCCWCNDPFDLQQKADARSRHRDACHQKAIISLQV